MDAIYIPPKPAIIVPRAPEIIRPGDPRYVVPQYDERSLRRSLKPGGLGVKTVGGKRRRKAGEGNDVFTKLLLHCDGADGSTTFTDASGSAHGNATVSGNAQVDTAQSMFGGASLLCDGTGDYLTYTSHADWNLGAASSGDFTIDFWLRMAALGQYGLVCAGNLSGTGWNLYYSNALGGMRLYAGTGTTRAWTPSTDIWYHVAVVRSGSSVTCYIDGTSIGSLDNHDMNNDSTALSIAAGTPTGTFSLNGWMDEVRISKIARWTANFTPPATAYS